MSKQLETMEIRTLGERRGNPRLWIDGDQAMRGGFAPGVEFNPKVDKERCMLTLEVVTSGGERVVSKKIVRDREIPVIDINNSDAPPGLPLRAAHPRPGRHQALHPEGRRRL